MMIKRIVTLFLILALSGIGCVPPPPPPGHPKASARVPVPPPPANSAEAAAAVEAGVIAAGVGLTILDIILSGHGPRRGVRSGPVRHPR